MSPSRLLLATTSALSLLAAPACDGDPGVTTLMSTSLIPPGDACPAGGVRISTGADLDHDGVLEVQEVQSTSFVCHGADGVDGANGVDGVDGANGEDGRDGVDGEDGLDGLNGLNGSDGEDGSDAAVRVTPIAPDPDGACWFGGVLVQVGTDLDDDGVLDDWEVTDSEPLCAIHVNEQLTLIEQSLEPPGDNCEHGGIAIVVGYDADGDEVLDPEEAGPPGYVCNQMTVIHGTSTLLDVTDATGNQCAFGGYVLRSGPDADADGALSTAEVVDTEVVCNGSDGLSSAVKMVDAGDQCGEDGGFVVSSGLDADSDGVLDASEIQTTGLVCNGHDGFLGYDGKTSLVRLRDDNGACGAMEGFILQTGLDDDDDGILEPAEVDDQEVICDGIDGFDSLVAMHDDSYVCPYGGVRVESGLDVDYDGVLDPGEVDHEAWLCDGYDGYNSLIEVSDANNVCTYGGVRIETGLDTDEDGNLDSGEVEHEAYVCDGADGFDSLVEVSDASSVCPYGGVLVETGLDLNYDGYLSYTEVENEAYVCDGYNGYNSLVEVDDAWSCADGGIVISVGLDTDEDGWLDYGEIESETTICF